MDLFIQGFESFFNSIRLGQFVAIASALFLIVTFVGVVILLGNYILDLTSPYRVK